MNPQLSRVGKKSVIASISISSDESSATATVAAGAVVVADAGPLELFSSAAGVGVVAWSRRNAEVSSVGSTYVGAGVQASAAAASEAAGKDEEEEEESLETGIGRPVISCTKLRKLAGSAVK